MDKSGGVCGCKNSPCGEKAINDKAENISAVPACFTEGRKSIVRFIDKITRI